MVEVQALHVTRRRQLPNRREHESFEIICDGRVYHVGIGRFDDGRIAELFINSGKTGEQVDSFARDLGVCASLILQHGVPAAALLASLSRLDNGDPAGPLGQILARLA